MLFLLAQTLGKTSPNSKIKKVTKMTSTVNFSNGDAIDSNKFLPITENKITTPILIKLLATNKVANNFLGFSKSEEMIWVFVVSSCAQASRSFGVNEKQATSAADTNAEQKSNTKMPIKPKSKFESMVESKLKLGSGSKLNTIG